MEVIFAGMETQTYDYYELTVDGITMQVEKVGLNQAKIVRLLSCRPDDYLNAAYTPGTMIQFHPSLET
jgi:hypothetical protein